MDNERHKISIDKVAGVFTFADIIRAGGKLLTGLGPWGGPLSPSHSLPGNSPPESTFAETRLRELASSKPESGMSPHGLKGSQKAANNSGRKEQIPLLAFCLPLSTLRTSRQTIARKATVPIGGVSLPSSSLLIVRSMD